MKNEMIKKIYNIVSKEFNLDFKKSGRKSELVIARDFYYALCRKHLSHGMFRVTVKEIGLLVNRNHSSVVIGSRRIDNILFNNKDLQPVYLKLNNLVKKEIIISSETEDILSIDLIEKQKNKVDILRTELEKEIKILDILLS